MRRLSSWAQGGLEYARELANDGRERKLAALRGEKLEERLTVQQIAREDCLSPFEVYDQIKRARIELFGADLSDSAIYSRLRRDRAVGEPSLRDCEEEGCTSRLPPRATARRRYCERHLLPHARIARYRRRLREQDGETSR